MRPHPRSVLFFRRPASASRGFTLVELLTVVAIIGVLAAILFPAIGAARRKASSTRSVGNLKQFGSAYALFAADNKGRLPPAGMNGASEELFGMGSFNKGWDYFLFPYLFPENDYQNLPKQGENLMMHPLDENTATAGARRTYAANSGATPVADSTDSTWTLGSSLNAPSKIILVTERPCGAGTIAGRSFSEVDPKLQLRDIPAGFELNSGTRFNYLFADGHVQTLDWADTTTSAVTATTAGGKTYTGTAATSLWLNN